MRVVATRHDRLHVGVVRLLAHRREVHARAEVAARAREDGAANLGLVVDILVSEHEAGEHVGGECVLLLRAIHREDHDTAVAFDRAVPGADVESFGHGPRLEHVPDPAPSLTETASQKFAPWTKDGTCST